MLAQAILRGGGNEEKGLAWEGGLARIRAARLYWHFPDRIYDGTRRIRSPGPPKGGGFLLRPFPARPYCGSPAAGYRRAPPAAGQVDAGARLRGRLSGEPAARLYVSEAGAGHFRWIGAERAEPSARAVGYARG